jgi:hypothetical protein
MPTSTRPAAAPVAAAGAHSSASTIGARRSPRTRRVPEPIPRRHGYRLEAGLVARLREERRAQIEHARANGVTLEERDGRVYRVLHLR